MALSELDLGASWGTHSRRAANVHITGLPAERCRCGAVVWSNAGESARQALADLAPALEVAVRRAGHLTLRWGQPTAAGSELTRAGETTRLTPTFEVREPAFRLADVILPQVTRIQLEEVLVQLEHHETIYTTWGFRLVDPVGRGASLNFYGPPGTGKTRAAEALAGELGRGLLTLTAGDLESRYMGETAKNVQAAFSAARTGDCVLLFDEADSLFGRRASEVTQGVDHEVNVTKSTLLIELERFTGIVVLASNFAANYDQAFRRRIAHHIEFQMPDRTALRRLWDLHLVPRIPIDAPREELLDTAVDLSEGLTGGDVLTALRLALPAMLHRQGPSARLGAGLIAEMVDRVRDSKCKVARPADGPSTEPGTFRSMFRARAAVGLPTGGKSDEPVGAAAAGTAPSLKSCSRRED